MGFTKDLKSKFRKLLGSKRDEDMRKKESLPGTQEVKKDIGKEVFEKTGSLREGVGQSSTRAPIKSRQNAIEQSQPVKSHHGIKPKE